LRAKKTYGLKVLLIYNAFAVSVWRVVLNSPLVFGYLTVCLSLAVIVSLKEFPAF